MPPGIGYGTSSMLKSAVGAINPKGRMGRVNIPGPSHFRNNPAAGVIGFEGDQPSRMASGFGGINPSAYSGRPFKHSISMPSSPGPIGAAPAKMAGAGAEMPPGLDPAAFRAAPPSRGPRARKAPHGVYGGHRYDSLNTRGVGPRSREVAGVRAAGTNLDANQAIGKAPSAPGQSLGKASPLSMPGPSIAPGARTGGGGSPMSHGASGIGGALTTIGGGMLLGGGMSYATGGSFGQGAVMGAAGGGALAYGLPAAGKFAARRLGQGGPGGYGTAMSRFVKGMENPTARRFAFGAGAMLGGGMFGGNKSHKRGFSSNRGNHIGR